MLICLKQLFTRIDSQHLSPKILYLSRFDYELHRIEQMLFYQIIFLKATNSRKYSWENNNITQHKIHSNKSFPFYCFVHQTRKKQKILLCIKNENDTAANAKQTLFNSLLKHTQKPK